MKHNIIKSITLSYLCMIIFCTLSGCRAHDQNTSNNISTETEADFKETAVFEESREVIEGFLEENYITANELPIDLFADNTVSETQKIPEVTDTMLDMLIENVKSMRPVMKWFVYGCDVIDYEQDIQYFTDNGIYYFLINDPEFSEAGINSIESLKDYLHQFFTAEYTESIMENHSSKFLEADGEL